MYCIALTDKRCSNMCYAIPIQVDTPFCEFRTNFHSYKFRRSHDITKVWLKFLFDVSILRKSIMKIPFSSYWCVYILGSISLEKTLFIKHLVSTSRDNRITFCEEFRTLFIFFER